MIRFHVTQEDINNGRHRDISSCPIALAIKRRLPHLSEVAVGPFLVTVRSDIGSLSSKASYLSSEEVTKFIQCYDDRKACEPFSFELTELNRTA